jgi:type II restriction enzyme
MPEITVIDHSAIARREHWIANLESLKGKQKDAFREAAEKIDLGLSKKWEIEGNSAIIDHLRLCGDIPEGFGHDSTAEKLYSKYTDAILTQTFRAIGLRSFVLKERADAADVEAFADDFSFVADAKAFRLSRTAKNQKDFKVQSMYG